MFDVPGFTDLRLLHEGPEAAVLEGVRADDGARVVLKIATVRHPGAALSSRFDREYQITSALEASDVVQCLERREVDGRPLLVFAGDGGRSLREAMNRRRLTLAESLRVGADIARALVSIHQNAIIHRDVKPSNIIVDEALTSAKLTDFGIATRGARGGQGLGSDGLLQGTLAYMSPEQTGRMNRGVDHRTDFYSLGVTLYEMLTGRTPFEVVDAMSTIHAQIARRPEPPSQVDSAVPALVSDLVMKLLAKNAEDRYQSAAALLLDLVECLSQLEASGRIEPFPLAARDVSDRFTLSQRLYGREEERAALLDTFSQARDGGRSLVLVAGAAGVGKSALVNEIDRPVVEAGGHFVGGKFAQFGRNEPYSALLEAFEGLTSELLALPEQDLARWREELVEALGANAAVLTAVLPSLAALVGDAEEPAPLSGADAANRFRQVFLACVQVFCQQDRPLVLFLDDVQWADHATVGLLEALLRDERTINLVIIAAYRDAELGPASPFARARARLEEAEVPLVELLLQPLDERSVNALIADSLASTPEATEHLAGLVHRRTLGNPFFVSQVLHQLVDEGALHFDHAGRCWTWDVEAIRALGVTDNVVDLLTSRLSELDPACQRALQLAACIGNRFELSALAAISGATRSETLAALQPALTEGLIVPARSSEKTTAVVPLGSQSTGDEQRFRFRHDRVHQAAWATIDDAERPTTQLSIGRRLVESLGADVASRIFEVVGHLNAAVDLVEGEERAQLARFNAMAADRAFASFAHAPALEHVDLALQLAGDGLWQEDYDTALTLHVQGAAAAAASGAQERMRALCDAVFANGRDAFDKLPAWETLINHHFAAGEQVDVAMELTYDALEALGLKLPRKATALHVAWHLAGVKLALRGKTPEDLAALPPLTDERILAILRLLVSVDGVAYMANPNAFAMHPLVAIKLSLKHGHCSASGWAYNLYGAILAAGLGDIAGGTEIATFGFDLARRLEDDWMCSRIATPYYVTVACWSTPMQEMRDPFEEWSDRSLALGAYNPVGANLMYLQFTRFFAGLPLDQAREEQRSARRQCEALEQQIAVEFIALFEQLTDALTDAEAPELLGAAEMTAFENAKNGNGVFAVHFVRALRCWYLGDVAGALEHSDLSTAEEEAAAGTVFAQMHTFYRALIALAAADGAPGRRRRLLKEGRKRLKTLRKWQGFSAHNMRHRADLVEAEIARLEGRHGDATPLYDAAHRGAREGGFINEAAMAVERAGRWQLALGATSVGELLLADARYEYGRWGASQVAEAMSDGVPRLTSGERTITATLPGLRTTNSGSHRSLHDGLDLATVLQTAQTVSGEIVLDRLLTRVMEAATENAGAEAGVLLLNEDEGLVVQAARFANGTVEVLQSQRPGEHGGVSPGIVQWVRRTGKHLVLDDASAHTTFGRDPYVRSKGVRSVLCVPLKSQAELIAVLYLENNLTPAAFTPERIELMTLLSSQAAISIRNARLYAQQVELTESYSRFVPREFLSHLGRESVLGVELGDSVEIDMAVLFSDIRGFTSLSERMSPQENFTFLNEFLGVMGPAIRQHQGFIDKYIGDAIMALFPGGVGDACRAACAMQEQLAAFNTARSEAGKGPVQIGTGVHLGRLMLGTIGEPQRMEGTVISDAVNVAARLESLTKTWSVPVLLSETARHALPAGDAWAVRSLGRVKLKGKREDVGVFELLDADREARARKEASADRFARAIDDLHAHRYATAEAILEGILVDDPQDGPARLLLNRCRTERVREAGLFEALD